MPPTKHIPELTVLTCQGVGDIFWTYQLLYPYVGKLNVQISVTNTSCPVQRRALDFLQTWPKVGAVSIRPVGHSVYDSLAKGRYRTAPILDAGLALAEHACNAWLEQGTRLEAIDPKYPPAWAIQLPQEDPGIGYEQYVCLYISGSKPTFSWDIEQWVQLVELLYQKNNVKLPLVIIGASYDANRVRAAEWQFRARKNISQVRSLIDMPPEQVNHTLAHAKFFVGYQSGLNVLADNLGCPQLMLYFPFLKPMMYTWCQPHHIHTRRFCADTFDHSPKEVVEAFQGKIG